MGDTGFEPVTSAVCMLHMILKNSLISYFFYCLFVSLPLFFLCCPILAQIRLFSPKNSHSFSHNCDQCRIAVHDPFYEYDIVCKKCYEAKEQEDAKKREELWPEEEEKQLED